MTNHKFLSNYLFDRDNDSIVVERGIKQLFAREIKKTIPELRQRHTLLKGRRVALRIDDSMQLIQLMIALDGYCAALLLIPGSTTRDQQQDFIERANIEYLITESTVKGLNIEDSILTNDVDSTEWLLTTSGTTGSPKVVSHDIYSLTRAVKKNVTVGKKLKWGLLYDPCRFAGLQVILQSIIGNSTLILPIADLFHEQIKSIVKNGCNALSATPTLWRKLLMDKTILDADLVQITLGGEIADQQIITTLTKAFPKAKVIHVYASTEAGVGFSVRDGQSGFPVAYIEKGLPGIDMKVDDNGYLFIKVEGKEPTYIGKNVTRLVESDGYINTQDLVEKRGERYYILGRANGSINVGGNKVHPEKIEEIIRKVAGVSEASVYGKSNSIMGQLVYSDIVIKAGYETQSVIDKIRKQCADELERYMIPVAFNVVSDINLDPGGKVRRIS